MLQSGESSDLCSTSSAYALFSVCVGRSMDLGEKPGQGPKETDIAVYCERRELQV